MSKLKKPYIVGIAGGSGSGKTTFLNIVKKRLPINSISVISQDDYYKPKDQQAIDENGEINFDLPDAVERQKLHKDLVKLTKGVPIEIVEYTFNVEKESQVREIFSAPIIIVEGLFVFHYEEIRNLLDLQIYIDVREDLKLERRLKRDTVERGYPEVKIRYQWDHHVVPSYKKFLKPYRDNADVIITNNTNFNKGLDVIVNHLKAQLSK